MLVIFQWISSENQSTFEKEVDDEGLMKRHHISLQTCCEDKLKEDEKKKFQPAKILHVMMSSKLQVKTEIENESEEAISSISNDLSKKQDPGNCNECPICYQECEYETELPDCGHKFCFLCIKGVALRHGTCPLCRKHIPYKIFRNPVLTTLSDQPTTSGSSAYEIKTNEMKRNESEKHFEDDVQWFYEARHGGWWRYERRHEDDVEKAYQRGLHNIDMLIAGSLYCIDFENMCQYRKDAGRSGRYTRSIKRVQKSDSSMDDEILGIAGLRTSTNLSRNVEQDVSEDLTVVTLGLSNVNVKQC